jgi:hypothetical protein
LSHNQRDSSQGFVHSLFTFVTNLIKKFTNLFFNNRYNLDDILYILRPFIYVYSVMKYGRRSFKPIKIALVLDIVSIGISLIRLIRSANSKDKKHKLRTIEKKEIMRRIWETLIKYLVRDPIFESYTKVLLERVFGALRISRLLPLLLSIVNYFRYYSYIA